MKDLFELRESDRPERGKYNLNLTKPKCKQISFCYESSRVQRPKIWNSFPHHVKPSENL